MLNLNHPIEILEILFISLYSNYFDGILLVLIVDSAADINRRCRPIGYGWTKDLELLVNNLEFLKLRIHEVYIINIINNY